jgi:cellulose synthase/poly-beta-1,6-N-acetylglucosamine synthase-like glycosyltransferase
MIELFFLCTSILVFCYAAVGLVFAIALRIKPAAGSSIDPKISVIVAAKNEAFQLPACLNALAALDYPIEKIEIVIVDDDSNDSTAPIVQEFSLTFPQIRYLKLDASQKCRPGKAGAIMYGIDHSSGEIIFITDADCKVPGTWIRSLLSLFSAQDGLVGGFTLLDGKPDRTSFFGKIQSCDWLFLLSAASAAANIGKPLSWVGNNMAFRRKVYEEVGGYQALGFSLIEDFALENAIATQTKWRVRFAALPEALVHSTPAPSLARFYQQRKRWSTGIRAMRPLGKAIMALSFLAHICALSLAAEYWLPSLSYVLVLMLTDLILLYPTATFLKRRDLLCYFPAFQLFLFCYTICLPVMFLFDRRVVWKDEKYRVNLTSVSSEKVKKIEPTTF